MNLYLLEPIEEAGYEEFGGFVVRAKTEDEARRIVFDRVTEPLAKGMGPEDDDQGWDDPLRTTCKLLTDEGPAEIVLESFHAG